MTGCESDGFRLVLLNRDRRRGQLLADTEAVELTRQLLTCEDPADDLPCSFARSSVSLAAWLVDRVTLGACQPLLSHRPIAKGFGEPTTLGPPWPTGGLSIENRLAKLSRGDLLELLTDSLQLCQVSRQDAAAWRGAQRRSLTIAQRAVQLSLTDCPDRSTDVRWWALYWTSPVGTVDERTSCWTLVPPVSLPTNLPADHPLQPYLDSLRRAVAEVDSLPEPPGVVEHAADPHDSASLRGMLPIVLGYARRTSEWEHNFQQTLDREKLRAMKELAYGASHEINNPLANISSRAQLLLRDETDPERRRSLSTINSQAFRAHEMIADMMLFAKPPALQPEVIELGAFLDETINQLAAQLEDTVTLERDLALGHWPCSCDPVQLAVAIGAIWSNALEAMGDNGHLRASARVVTAADGSPWAEFELADSGPGIRPEVRRHLFDPFYSGREAGRGLGFGLSKAWRIVDLHSGEIHVASDSGQGTSVTIRLPLTSPWS
jgi:signal transduction histidine kinase